MNDNDDCPELRLVGVGVWVEVEVGVGFGGSFRRNACTIELGAVKEIPGLQQNKNQKDSDQQETQIADSAPLPCGLVDTSDAVHDDAPPPPFACTNNAHVQTPRGVVSATFGVLLSRCVH